MTMRGLLAQELLYIWEMCLQQHPVDRALTILAMALPEVSRQELLALSAGQRDTHLLAVRERTLGSQLACFAECPACQERLEFVFDVADIRVMPQIEDGTGDVTWDVTEGAINRLPTQGVYEVTIEGYDLRFRLPDSVDLAEIARCGDVDAARNLLVQRCVIRADKSAVGTMPHPSPLHGVEREQRARADKSAMGAINRPLQLDGAGTNLDGAGTSLVDLPETVIAALAEYMTQCDPQADVQLNLSCPACGQSWTVMFDIVSFFWSEICAQAKRLLREVHTLARAYSWREADILNMSTARRQFYLEMVS
jgi:hypothetical protein